MQLAPSKPICIVVTPGSGEGRARKTARRIERLLRRRGHVVATRTFGDLPSLVEWARSIGPEFGLVVCVGGDATQSAASILAQRQQIPFVPVPSGFGNLFASAFDHPRSPRRVLRLLRRGIVRMVDIGVAARDEPFLSHRSYGFLESVQERVEAGRRQPKSRGKRLAAYWWMAVRAIATVPLAPIGVEVDAAQIADDAILVTVANVETYRGFLSLTPSASPIDGQFDVFVVPRTSKLGLAWRLFKLALRLPGRWNGVRLYRGRSVTVTAAGKQETLTVVRRALPLVLLPRALRNLERRQVAEAAPVHTLA